MSEKTPKQHQSDYQETLQFVVESHRKEMERHQTIVGNIFFWTQSIMLAMGAANFGLAGSATGHVFMSRWQFRLSISAISILIPLFAMIEIFDRGRAYDANARVVVKASKLLHLFESNVFSRAHEQLYEESWLHWGDRNHRSYKFKPIFYSVVLCLLGICVAILPWAMQ